MNIMGLNRVKNTTIMYMVDFSCRNVMTIIIVIIVIAIENNKNFKNTFITVIAS